MHFPLAAGRKTGSQPAPLCRAQPAVAGTQAPGAARGPGRGPWPGAGSPGWPLQGGGQTLEQHKPGPGRRGPGGRSVAVWR
jgi:hypothetical protein